MTSFGDLSKPEGQQELDQHLKSRSYVDGYQASRDDLVVFSSISTVPDKSQYPHLARWYNHITALLGASFPGKGGGVKVAGPTTAAIAEAVAKPQTQPAAPEDDEDETMDYDDEEDDDEDLDLFGEATDEEKAARQKVIDEAKKRGEAKAKLTKSMIVLDVKPWDDTTDLLKLEQEVRSIKKDGLLWGSSKLVPVGYGIKKMQITAVIEDAKVESMDAIIEEELVRDGESELIQSIDVVSFNKL